MLPDHNRRFAKSAAKATDAHRRLGPGHRLESILSIQTERVVSNDYVVRLAGRFYQLLPPVYPGERGGRVVIEKRLDGTMKIRFGNRYLEYREVSEGCRHGGSAPKPPEFIASSADASVKGTGRGSKKPPRPAGIQPTAGRSGRTPAEPYPSDGEVSKTASRRSVPAENHPWRKGFKQLK